MPGTQGYAVVSCHVERPLDDRIWQRYSALLRSRPGGFAITSMLRPPFEGEDEPLFLERARAASALGAIGHHTHWTSPSHARPTTGAPAERVLREGRWLREQGLEPAFFCGGGWYTDADVIAAVAELGYVDCTATATRPGYLPAGAPRAQLEQPAWIRLGDGRRVFAVPATHSLGSTAAALPRALPRVVHVHFHDYELLDRKRQIALRVTLALLARRRTAVELSALSSDREVAWSDIFEG